MKNTEGEEKIRAAAILQLTTLVMGASNSITGPYSPDTARTVAEDFFARVLAKEWLAAALSHCEDELRTTIRRQADEIAELRAAIDQAYPEAAPKTPSSHWKAEGKPDPHGAQYDGERAALCLGDLTDDELANAVFLCNHRTDLKSIAYITAAKERIRWLSRKLEALASAPQSQSSPVAVVLAEVERATRKFPTWPTDPLHALAVLGEEFGELTQATLQTVYEPHKSNPADVREEAVQVAAMALRFIASLDRYNYARCEQHVQGGQPEAQPR